MKAIYFYPLLFSLLFSTSFQDVFAQKKGKAKSSSGEKTEREFVEINGAKYEVLSGLAEILAVEKVVNADESPLKYDEYEVLFKFHRYEGGPLQMALQEMKIPFRLKHKTHEFRVGPEYLKIYQVRKGLKFSMKFMQNVDGRGKEYVYQSRGLPNDIAEARENMNDLIREIYADKLRKQEGQMDVEEYNSSGSGNPRDNSSSSNTNVKPIASTTDNTNDDPKDPDTDVIDSDPIAGVTDTDNPDATTDNPNAETVDTTTTDDNTTEADTTIASLGELDEERIKKELEAEILRKLEEEKRQKELLAIEDKKRQEEADRKNKVKEAKRKKKEEDRKKKEEEERLRLEAEKKAQEEAALREKLRAELEAKLRADQKEKEAEEERLRIEAERKKKEEEVRKNALKAREEARRRSKEDEIKRASCNYKSRQSGIISIKSVEKTVEKSESFHGYEEYEVKVSFRPDNYADLEKKDKRFWDSEYTFVIDPKGKSANPSARYVRQYLIPKGLNSAQFKGFAQPLETGICNPVMFFAPELPSGSSELR